MTDETTELNSERRILRAMRKTLTSVVKDATPVSYTHLTLPTNREV